MGLILNGGKQGRHIINGGKHNAFINGEKVWKVDQTVLNGLLLWCSGTKSNKAISRWDDISGKNNHIGMSNATISDNGFEFNGSNTLGAIPVNLNIWNSTATCIVIAKYNPAANYKGIIGDHYSSGGAGFVLGQYENGNIIYGFYPPTTTAQTSYLAFNNLNFTNGTSNYNEIATVYDGNVLSIFVNGVLKQNKTIGAVSTRSANMSLGRSMDYTDGRYFQGNVRDLKFYNRALSAAEVLQNYNQNKSENIIS